MQALVLIFFRIRYMSARGKKIAARWLQKRLWGLELLLWEFKEMKVADLPTCTAYRQRFFKADRKRIWGFLWPWKALRDSFLWMPNNDANAHCAKCLNIAQKVAFNNANEASYVYFLSGQKCQKGDGSLDKWGNISAPFPRFLRYWAEILHETPLDP